MSRQPTLLRSTTVLITLFLIGLANIAWGQNVVPAPHITNPVTVREAPSSQSAPVGQLGPGETATLLERVPYWYHVHLSDGTVGFVSKVSTDEIEAMVAAPDPTIRLGAWNIKKLGHGSSKDFPRVAHVIDDHFDIVAVIEVMQKGGGHPGYDALVSELGVAWAGMVTDAPRPNTTAGHAEFYAIIYRTSLIEPCPGWTGLVYHQDNDGGASGTGPNRFSREPAFGCFQAPAGGPAVGVDFVLAAYHAHWGSGTLGPIQAEVSHLDDVFASMAAAQPGEQDLLIAGDYNLVPNKLQAVVSVPVDTEGSGSTVNSSGAVTTNVYDHVLIHDPAATQERIESPRILNVIRVATSPQGFYRTMSDHLPVALSLDASGPDDD